MSSVIIKASEPEVHEVPDGYVIYHGARDTVYYLNKTAAIVFELCDAGLEPDDIVARIAKIFNLDLPAHAKIRVCIDSLMKEGLILSKPT